MLDSDFWRELAERFRALDSLGMYLWASWSADLDASGRATPPSWTLMGVGDIGHQVEVLFAPMARRAAARSGVTGSLLQGWLNAVRDHIGGDASGSGFRTNSDGTRTEYIGGTLQRLCILSAEMCSQLESEALEREHGPPEEQQTIAPSRSSSVNNAAPLSVADERQAALNAYKRECKANGVKVTDAMIAKAASSSWNDRTQVTWWKRNDPQSKPFADRAIRRVLSEKPHLRSR